MVTTILYKLLRLVIITVQRIYYLLNVKLTYLKSDRRKAFREDSESKKTGRLIYTT